MKHSLTQYREKNHISMIEFAQVVGVNRSTIFRIESGTHSPSLDLAYKIEQATGGKVTASMLAAAAQKRESA